MWKLGLRRARKCFVFALSLLALVSGHALASPQERGAVTRVGRIPAPTKPRALGRLVPRPDGSGWFFRDPHRRGLGTELRLTGLSWGRLVDVHALLPGGAVDPRPVFPSFVIGESVQTDGVDYVLERNPVTQVERLVVLRQLGPEFVRLVRIAAGELEPIQPKNDDGTAALPISLVKRNAALVVRFDDLLDDSAAAAAELAETVRVLVGYPPSVPFQGRILFDPNFGGVTSGGFHSSRVIVDLTISELEAQGMTTPAPVNALGLPSSIITRRDANASLRLPTQVDPGSGQFSVLTSLGGAPLSTTTNGPVDLTSPTLDVVRAMRSGNERDPDRGFLQDEDAPELLGGFPMEITDATGGIPGGELGFDFLIILAFQSSCQATPLMGDVLQVGAHFLEVREDGTPPNSNGQVTNLLVRNLGSEPIDSGDIEGPGLFLTPYRGGEPIELACWFSFVPQPGSPPSGGVSTLSQVLVRFSEPLASESVRPLDTLRIVNGSVSGPIASADIVVGEVRASSDLGEFTVTPLLPLAHVQGTSTAYHVDLGEVVDLAGNPLAAAPFAANFTIDPAEPSQANGGIVLRFASADELEPLGAFDLRGQFLYDLDRELVRPRDLMRASYAADRTAPVGGIKIPFPPGTQAPLSPLGSKVQTVWRYVEFGWQVEDETKFNLDIEGLAWAPPGGQVVADFFEEFEIRLAHSSRLPDEDIDIFLLPKYPLSGLLGAAGEPFAANILDDPVSPQKVVHPRALGYELAPGDQFVAATGTTMMPFPLNRAGAPRTAYTWRDTAVLARGGDDGAGIPLDIEAGPPLFLESAPGAVAPVSEVPSIGLPLLLELRAYPTDAGIGLNVFDVSLAINSSSRPYFRAYSTGGVDTSGAVVTKDPDLEVSPSGGFNPNSNPPGRPTPPLDNVNYLGLIDTVTRVSRVHSIFIDTGITAPDYLDPLIESSTPAASSVAVEYRGAILFSSDSGTAPFDALQIDPYGDPEAGTVVFLNGVDSWTDDIDDVDGARFLQLRFTFVGDVDQRQIALLEGLGIAFSE